MANYVTSTNPKHFQPMNASFALLPGLEGKKIRNKKERHLKISERGLHQQIRLPHDHDKFDGSF